MTPLFLLTIVTACVALAFELRYLWRMRRCDDVLFSFRKLRSDTLKLIVGRIDHLGRDEYLAARVLLTAIDASEHAVEIRHPKFFNARAFAKFMREVQASQRCMHAVPEPASPELRALYARFGVCVLRGFLAYTPFFASEMVAHFLLFLLSKLWEALGHVFGETARMAGVTYASALEWLGENSDPHSGMRVA